jgi:hypothetical protein
VKEEEGAELVIRPFGEGDDAEEVAGWRYPPPYDVYDEPAEAGGPAADPDRHAFVLRGQLVGFCSFGADARYGWARRGAGGQQQGRTVARAVEDSVVGPLG